MVVLASPVPRMLGVEFVIEEPFVGDVITGAFGAIVSTVKVKDELVGEVSPSSSILLVVTE